MRVNSNSSQALEFFDIILVTGCVEFPGSDVSRIRTEQECCSNEYV